MKISVYNIKGVKKKDIEVSEKIFGLPFNADLVHQVYVAAYSNKRQNLAHAKTRGERKGSGAKPWAQKGTGRARVGDVRTPIWRKGGVVFGPSKERNYKKNINKKMKSKALWVVLSEKIRDKEMKVIDEIKLAEKKTKEMASLLKALKVSGSTLIAFSKDEKEMRRASNNLDKVKNISTSRLNVFDILNSKNLVLSQNSIEFLENKYNSQVKE